MSTTKTTFLLQATIAAVLIFFGVSAEESKHAGAFFGIAAFVSFLCIQVAFDLALQMNRSN